MNAKQITDRLAAIAERKLQIYGPPGEEETTGELMAAQLRDDDERPPLQGTHPGQPGQWLREEGHHYGILKEELRELESEEATLLADLASLDDDDE